MYFVDICQRDTIEVVTENVISSLVFLRRSSTARDDSNSLTIITDCLILQDLIFNLNVSRVGCTNWFAVNILVEGSCITDLNIKGDIIVVSILTIGIKDILFQDCWFNFRNNARDDNVVIRIVHTMV